PVLAVDVGAGDERGIGAARDPGVEIERVGAAARRRAARVLHRRALDAALHAQEAALERDRGCAARSVEERAELVAQNLRRAHGEATTTRRARSSAPPDLRRATLRVGLRCAVPL